jgi:hypothetical protein
MVRVRGVQQWLNPMLTKSKKLLLRVLLIVLLLLPLPLSCFMCASRRSIIYMAVAIFEHHRIMEGTVVCVLLKDQPFT